MSFFFGGSNPTSPRRRERTYSTSTYYVLSPRSQNSVPVSSPLSPRQNHVPQPSPREYISQPSPREYAPPPPSSLGYMAPEPSNHRRGREGYPPELPPLDYDPRPSPNRRRSVSRHHHRRQSVHSPPILVSSPRASAPRASAPPPRAQSRPPPPKRDTVTWLEKDWLLYETKDEMRDIPVGEDAIRSGFDVTGDEPFLFRVEKCVSGYTRRVRKRLYNDDVAFETGPWANWVVDGVSSSGKIRLSCPRRCGDYCTITSSLVTFYINGRVYKVVPEFKDEDLDVVEEHMFRGIHGCEGYRCIPPPPPPVRRERY